MNDLDRAQRFLEVGLFLGVTAPACVFLSIAGVGGVALYGCGVVLGAFAMALYVLFRAGATPRKEEAAPIRRGEEELLRLADAWMIVAELKDDCDGEFQMLDQDRVVHGLNALDAAVNGEERCIEPDEFFERRTMALARMREVEGK